MLTLQHIQKFKRDLSENFTKWSKLNGELRVNQKQIFRLTGDKQI